MDLAEELRELAGVEEARRYAEPLRVPVKNRVSSLRRQRGLSLGRLAEELGIGRRTVGYVENDGWVPRLDDAHGWADYFGVSLEEVFYPVYGGADGEEAEEDEAGREDARRRRRRKRYSAGGLDLEEEDYLFLQWSVLTRLVDYGAREDSEVIEMLRISCRRPEEVIGDLEESGLLAADERSSKWLLRITDEGRLWVMDLYEDGEPEWVSSARRRQHRRVVFASLWRRKAVSANRLEREIGLPAVQVFKALRRLNQEGLIDVRVTGKSLRHVEVVVTEDGSLEAERELGRVGYRMAS